MCIGNMYRYMYSDMHSDMSDNINFIYIKLPDIINLVYTTVHTFTYYFEPKDSESFLKRS